MSQENLANGRKRSAQTFMSMGRRMRFVVPGLKNTGVYRWGFEVDYFQNPELYLFKAGYYPFSQAFYISGKRTHVKTRRFDSFYKGLIYHSQLILPQHMVD